MTDDRPDTNRRYRPARMAAETIAVLAVHIEPELMSAVEVSTTPTATHASIYDPIRDARFIIDAGWVDDEPLPRAAYIASREIAPGVRGTYDPNEAAAWLVQAATGRTTVPPFHSPTETTAYRRQLEQQLAARTKRIAELDAIIIQRDQRIAELTRPTDPTPYVDTVPRLIVPAGNTITMHVTPGCRVVLEAQQ